MAYELGEIYQQPAIVQWFVIRRIPEGTAPLAIREQWLDIPLPLRKLHNMDGPQPQLGTEVDGSHRSVVIEDATTVETNDAIKALRLFGRDEAADWWRQYQLQSLSIQLHFNATEGEYWSPQRLARVLPSVNEFDEIII